MENLDRLLERCFSELTFSFIRGSGPGGQNVNKVATAVQLRFDVRHSPSLTDAVKHRLARIAGRRLTATGTLVIEARRYRTQAQNRDDALERFATMLVRSTETPKPRRRTKPSKASGERRLESKKKRAEIKRTRQAAEAD
jgi:ribosome-associated protein